MSIFSFFTSHKNIHASTILRLSGDRVAPYTLCYPHPNPVLFWDKVYPASCIGSMLCHSLYLTASIHHRWHNRTALFGGIPFASGLADNRTHRIMYPDLSTHYKIPFVLWLSAKTEIIKTVIGTPVQNHVGDCPKRRSIRDSDKMIPPIAVAEYFIYGKMA